MVMMLMDCGPKPLHVICIYGNACKLAAETANNSGFRIPSQKILLSSSNSALVNG